MKTFLTVCLFISFCLSPLSGGEWISSLQVTPSGSSPAVQMDPQGNSIAIWLASPTQIVSGVLLSGDRAWHDFPVFTLFGPGSIQSPKLSVASNGNAVAVWINNTPDIKAVLYSSLTFGSETWSSPIIISPITDIASNPSLGVDANGNAIVVWQDVSSGVSSIKASAVPFASTVTPPSVTISTGQPQGFTPNVAVNSSGNAIAVWIGGDFPQTEASVEAAYYNGSWGTVQELTAQTTAPFYQGPIAAIAPSGNGVAVWYLPSGASALLQGSAYFSGGWNPTSGIATIPNNNPFLQLGIDTNGDALVTFVDNVILIISETLPASTTNWVKFQFVTTGAGPESLAVSPSGVATTSWVNSSTGFVQASMLPNVNTLGWGNSVIFSNTAVVGQITAIASDVLGEFVVIWQEDDGSLRSSFFDPFPTPPTPLGVAAARGFNQFLLQKELFITFFITPFPPGVNVVSYQIYSDSGLTQLVGQVNATASPLTFVLHNVQHIQQTYYVVSVDSHGFISAPAPVTL